MGVRLFHVGGNNLQKKSLFRRDCFGTISCLTSILATRFFFPVDECLD